MTSASVGIDWHWIFRFPAGSTDDVWFRGPGAIERVIDGLAATSLWPALDVMGRDAGPGAPFATAADVTTSIRDSDGGRAALARGGPRAAMLLDDTDAMISIDFSFAWLDVKSHASGDVLARIGPAFLDETIDLVAALRRWLGDRAVLIKGRATPVGALPRRRPPRQAHRDLDAIVDLLDTELGARPGLESFAGDAERMATAPLPSGVTREVRGPLVIQRWIEDPRDARALATAAARHERWMVDLVETWPLPGWNAAGDRVVELPERVTIEPFAAVDATTATAYLDLPAGDLDQVTLQRIRKLQARPPAGVRSIALVAERRDDVAPARAATGLRVVYRADGALWDPDPPGAWLEQDPTV